MATGDYFPGGKVVGAWRWPLSFYCAEVKNDITHPAPHVFTAWCLIKQKENFAFYFMKSRKNSEETSQNFIIIPKYQT
jgi:hypothetical protein